nr:hypothetical protein [Bacteroidota bacterium]
MKKISTIIIFSSVLLLANTCNKEKEDCHKTITIFNHSEKAIYILCDTHYPDTMYFSHSSSPTSDTFNNKILAKSASIRPLQNRDCWETIYNYGVQIPSDTLMVYVFDADVLENVDWADVVHYYLVLKRYDLSLDDLKQNNWTITYP